MTAPMEPPGPRLVPRAEMNRLLVEVLMIAIGGPQGDAEAFAREAPSQATISTTLGPVNLQVIAGRGAAIASHMDTFFMAYNVVWNDVTGLYGFDGGQQTELGTRLEDIHGTRYFSTRPTLDVPRMLFNLAVLVRFLSRPPATTGGLRKDVSGKEGKNPMK